MFAAGEAADYLSPYNRSVGGDLTMDRHRHTTRVQVFAGSRAAKMMLWEALLDTGSPASFVQER
ncbi:unnamed protein product [Ectocarpus sp. CCAP 1310/34]|nr:unnamed protein product [Ectocarpus sp. CCAP 1310/34]